MTIEDMLIIYPDIPTEIQRLNNELNIINQCKDETSDTLQAAVITGLPHRTDISNPTLTKTIELVDKYGSHAQHIIDQINDYIDLKEMIDNAWATLDKDEKKVLELRYFDRIRWDWIPAKMHYSRTRCFEIHNRAIKKIKLCKKKEGLKPSTILGNTL